MFCSHEKFNPRLLCLIPAKMDFLAHPLPLQGRSAFPLPGDPHGHSGQVRIRPRCDPQEAWSIPRSLPLSPMPEKVVHPHGVTILRAGQALLKPHIFFFWLHNTAPREAEPKGWVFPLPSLGGCVGQ